MRRSVAALVADALHAARAIVEVTGAVTLEEYLRVRMLRSAVEREFLILGEALNSLDALPVGARERVAELGRVVGLRNRLAHAYDLIDDRMLWSIAATNVPPLVAELEAWMHDLE